MASFVTGIGFVYGYRFSRFVAAPAIPGTEK